jgi:hypothetical protein
MNLLTVQSSPANRSRNFYRFCSGGGDDDYDDDDDDEELQKQEVTFI